uniref:serine hydrolase n=1 Tax=Pseudonocardia acaciae TaxID=551276 RepID=UPI00055D81EF
PATLRTALREVTLPRVGPPEGDQLALIWNLRPLDTHDLLFHAGATRGFTTFIGFSPRTHTGLAALTNTTPTFGNKFVQTAYLELRTLRVRVC